MDQSRGDRALLEVRDLNVAFETDRGQVRPVRGVSFSMAHTDRRRTLAELPSMPTVMGSQPSAGLGPLK